MLRYRLNPCDLERFAPLARIGDALAAINDAFHAGTDCACCTGARLVALTLTAVALGAGSMFLIMLLAQGTLP